ncbi:MAG: vitamin K epoxide reductase family protein [Candidatus Paceibacterota bacterium]
MDNKKLALVMLVLSFLGLLDASYLTFKHYAGGSIKCLIVSGCDVVTASSYSVWFGFLPVALLGVFFYFIALLLAFLVYDTDNIKWKKLLLGWALIGGLVASWFLYVQAFILEAYCSYCLISFGLTTLIVLGARVIYLRSGRATS